jgi:hypothetical protein
MNSLSGSGALHFLRKFRPEFREFWRDDVLTVGLIGIVREVFLMMFFRKMELNCRHDFGDDH